MRVIFRKLRFRLEVVLVKLGLLFIPLFPRPVVLGLARLTGVLGYYLAPGLRRLALTNMAIALSGSFSLKERKHLARRMFANFALVFLDFFWFTKDRTNRLKKYVQVDDWLRENLNQFSTIGVTAHFGNWELLAQSIAKDGVPVIAVAAPLNNPAVDVAFQDFRTKAGVKIIPKQGAIRNLLRGLRAGSNVALLLDQNVKPEDGGIFVDFMGLPTPMSTAAAILAERTKVPITIVFSHILPGGHYRVCSLPIWSVWQTPGVTKEQLTREITQYIADIFASEIQKHPAQWLWLYKRWKHIPPDLPREAFPYYAKEIRN